MIFRNRCWVSGPGVEFTGKGGEELLSGEEGRAPPLECPAACRRVPGQRGVIAVGSNLKFLRKGGPNDGWLTSTANSGSGPARLVRSWRQYHFARHYGFLSGRDDLRRGPDLFSCRSLTVK